MTKIIPTKRSERFFRLWQCVCLLLRLALTLCLSGKPSLALFIIAVVCSTWSAVNLHTSQRDILTPYGDRSRASVNGANRMVARLVMGVNTVEGKIT